jgi:hypothetical protein
MRTRWLPSSVAGLMLLLSLLAAGQALSPDLVFARRLSRHVLAGASVIESEAHDNPVPAITDLNPDSATVGGTAFTLTVNGINFVRGSVVRWNGADRGTAFVSSTQLQATITTADIAIAGTATVTVFNPAPGGGTSNALTFTINNPLPMIHSLRPSSVVVGGPDFTLTVIGASFVPSSVVQWNGSDRETTFVSRNQLRVAVTASDVAVVGLASVTIFNRGPGGGTSSAQTLPINNPLPVIDALHPSSATAGEADFTLTVEGTNFVTGSVVRWNGANRWTTFVRGTQLMATITAADIATPGTASVTVFTPAPGGGTSNARTFTIEHPVPTIAFLEPRWARAGGVAFTLTVNGTSFFRGSAVQWNGSARATWFVSSTQLQATITAPDIATSGTANVTVVNPAPGGGSSDLHRFRIYDRVLYLFLPGVMRGHRR